MLFSVHVAETSPTRALMRRQPKIEHVPGLRSARTAICGPFSPGAMPRPQLGRELLVACWQDEPSLDRFLATNETGRVFGAGWGMKLELFRAVGVWPGIDDDMDEVAAEGTAPDGGPSVAITIGTAYLRTARPFLKVNAGLEEQFLRSTDAVWGTGFTNLPQRLVGTLTVWDHADSAQRFMRSGAHGAAMKAHYDPAKDPTGHTFVTAGGFFGFRPISTSGSLGGKNPVPEELCSLITA